MCVFSGAIIICAYCRHNPHVCVDGENSAKLHKWENRNAIKHVEWPAQDVLDVGNGRY
jgi:hypothetical protein